MIYPLKEMQEFFDLKDEILSCLASAYLDCDNDYHEARLMKLMERIESISPPNKPKEIDNAE